VAIEGDLKDMSLMNVLQFICQDERNTVLYLTRKNEEGVIYFDCGEPVHATAGSLDGEEAVHQLLSWTEGTFRVTDYETIPRRTITTSWNDLILEWMRRTDGRGRGAKPKVENRQVVSQTDMQQDSSLENALILLMARLEQSRVHLLERNVQKQPALALRILTEMVNEISAFAQDHLYVDVLAEALAFEMDGHRGAELLQVENNRLSGQIAARYSDWGGDPASRRAAFQQVGECLMNVVKRYTSLIMSSFRMSSLVDQWSGTCHGFIVDLADAVERIQF
jgi:hypothetical protein